MVNVRIPKFRISSESRIAPALQKLGIGDLFESGKSDLSLMAPNEDLYLTDVAHK